MVPRCNRFRITLTVLFALAGSPGPENRQPANPLSFHVGKLFRHFPVPDAEDVNAPDVT